MRQFLLVSLFAILLSDIMLGLGLTLGPGLSLKNAVLYILFLMLVFEFTTGRRDPLREVWTLHIAWVLLVSFATFAWLAIVLMGIHRGYDGFESFIALKSQLVDLFLFMLVYMYGPKDIASTIRLLKWLIAVLVIVNAVTLVDFVNLPDLGIIGDRADGRLAGPLKEVNQYGATLIFILPITVGLAIACRGGNKFLFSLGSLIGFVLLGFTVSRGSYFGLFIGGLAGLFLVRDHLRRGVFARGVVLSMVTLTVVAAVIAYQDPESFVSRFDFAGSSLDSVSSGRIYFWRQTLTLMSAWPLSFLTGYGWNAYATLFLGYGDPHNTYLLYWFNLGIIGLASYVFIATWIVRYSIQSLRWVEAAVKPIVIGFVVGFISLHIALFFVSLYAPWMFIWAIAGTVMRLLAEQSRIAPSVEVNSPAVDNT